MPRIRTLRPNVTREEAIQQFQGGLVGLVRRLAFGPLRSVADFYLPYMFFRVEISSAGKTDRRIFGLESVTGSLDLYHFEQIPDSSQMISTDTRNCPEALLDENRARQLVIEKVRRALFSQGFFRVRELQLTATPISAEIHIPYWVGFQGSGLRAHVTVIDAIRRRVEGAKVRQLLENWLTGKPHS
jgi:hypothetical protein